MTHSIETNITATNNVVSNDVFELPKLPDLNVHILEGLEQKRKDWEEGAYRKSNMELYGILSECLLFSVTLPSKTAAKARNAELDKFFKLRGYQNKANTPLATKVVRAVFGNIDRRRTNVYSLVIRAALDAKVTPEDLPNWIMAQGGVEEIRRAASKNHVPSAERIELVKTKLEVQQALAVVKSDALSLVAEVDKIGQRCVLLAEQEADGSFSIHKLIYSDGAVNAAMLAVYAEANKEKSEAEATAEAVGDPTYALAA